MPVSTIRRYTYDRLPEKAQECAKGVLWSFGGSMLAYGGYLLYATGTCRVVWKVVPSCGNDLALTAVTHTALPYFSLSCAQIARDHFERAFS